MHYRVTQTGWLDGEFRREGDSIEKTEAEAKWLVLSGQLAMLPVASAHPARDPLDHDGDGKAGGSKPAVNVDDLTAAGLATAAELGTVDYNTLRLAARRFLGDDVPTKKAEIIAALHALKAA